MKGSACGAGSTVRFAKPSCPSWRKPLPPAMRNSPPPSAPQTRWPRISLRTMTNPPQPLRRGQKVGIVLVACSLVATIGLGSFLGGIRRKLSFSFLMTRLLQKKSFKKGYAFALDSPFSQNDVSWNQPRESQSYWLVLYNTNSLDTDVEIRYSKHLSSHSFTIPPKETLSFLVEDARPGEHILSFITSDGSFLGSVQIFLSKPTQ